MKRSVNRLIKLMEEKKMTLAFAESVTCGLLAHQLSTVKGTSNVLKGSIVCYHEDVKRRLLKVDKSLLKKYTAESEQVTIALVKQLRKLIKADVYSAVTGLASPGGSETRKKPPGTIFFAVSLKNKIHSRKKVFRGTPLEIRKKSCSEMYRWILSLLNNS